jgi:hypothetical protein
MIPTAPALMAPAPSTTLMAPGTPLPPQAPISFMPTTTVGQEVVQGDGTGWVFNGDYANSPYTFYGSGEYLLWKIDGGTIPSFATSVPVGVLYVQSQDTFTRPFIPDTQVVTTVNGTTTIVNVPSTQPPPIPPQVINNYAPIFINTTATPAGLGTSPAGEHSGFRGTFGFWCDPNKDLGLEVVYFALEPRSNGFQATNSFRGDQFLLDTGFNDRIINVELDGSREVTDQFPIFFVRQANITVAGSTTRRLWGTELNARSQSAIFGPLTVETLLGFRYLQFREDLVSSAAFTLFQPVIPEAPNVDPASALGVSNLPSTLTYTTSDTIRARNHFFGAQVGAKVEYNAARFFMSAQGKLGVGGIRQDVTINSFTTGNTLAVPGGATTGGLLTGAGDNGSYSRTRFTTVPEGQFKIGFFLTPQWRIFAGYDALYVDRVVRADGVSAPTTLSTTVTIGDTTRRINVSTPNFVFQDKHMFVQGVTFGTEFRY